MRLPAASCVKSTHTHTHRASERERERENEEAETGWRDRPECEELGYSRTSHPRNYYNYNYCCLGWLGHAWIL